MAQPNNHQVVLFIALSLIATTSVTKCQLLGANITQFLILGRGLTCSNPSPTFFSFFFSRPVLSGANVTFLCNNGGSALNTTTTTNSGDFNLIYNNPVITNVFFPLLGCQVLVTVPANCTITSFFQTITTLRSIVLLPIRLQPNLVGGGQTLVANSGLFFARFF